MDNLSKKELWIGLAVAFLTIAIAVMINPLIKDGMLKEVQSYERALRVDNNPSTFTYAQKTSVGKVLARGEFIAQEPQTVTELSGTYGIIEKVKEHYTMHTRTVCTTTGSGKNAHTTCHTEVYYSWDVVDSWTYSSQHFLYLGVTFTENQLRLSANYNVTLNSQTMASGYEGKYTDWYLYEESFLGVPTGNDRYYFKVLPVKVSATMFVNFVSGVQFDKIYPEVYLDKSPEQVIQDKKNLISTFDFWYYTAWIVVVVGGYLYFAYTIWDVD